MEVDRITRNADVMGGKPCVRGMRITVGTVVGLVASGHTNAEIAYAAWRVAEIEVPASGGMKLKFLIEMCVSPLWVQFFADSGIDSVHWSKIGPPSAPDTEIMDYASRNGLVIFTHDLDFGALLANRKASQPSVIRVRAQDILPAAIGDLIVRAINATRSHLEAGALVTVDPRRNRIRLLPI